MAGSWETTTLLQQLREEQGYGKYSWARPKRRITDWQLVLLLALHFVQSSSGLYKPSLRWQNKEGHLHWDDGATYPSQQPEWAAFKTLVLSWRRCYTKALALFPSVKQFPFYTELTLQWLLGLYRSAKPSHSGCWVKMPCSHLDWKVLLIPKETLSMRNTSDATFYTFHVWLTCQNRYFLGQWILFCTVIHHSGIGKSFCISPSSLPGGDPNQLIVLRNIFERGLNGNNFLTLAEWSINQEHW